MDIIEAIQNDDRDLKLSSDSESSEEYGSISKVGKDNKVAYTTTAILLMPPSQK